MAGPSPMPGGVATPQDLAVAMRYGPQTEQALRRSSYLTDALRQLTTEGSQNIHSGGELAAKLLATAILSRGANKGQDAVMSALRADQGDETARMLAGLGDSGAAPSVSTPPPAPIAQPPQAAPPPAAVAPPTPDAPPSPQLQAPPAQTGQYSPADRDALIHMAAVEAGHEGPQGIAAAMHVALNRLRNGYGGAKSLVDVIQQPHQFEAIQRGVKPDPQALATAQQVADQVLSGQTPDPTGGAMAFLNPELQVKGWPGRSGRPIPAWAQGQGQRIGNHVFFGGNPQVAQQSAVPPPSDQPADAPPPPPPAFDAGAMGAGANPSPPSAPAQSPGVGTAPVGVTPQAPSTGANPWPTWKPSPQERAYVEGLLNDPRTHQQGVQAAIQMRQKMTQPEEAQITMVNGVPKYVPKDPTSAAHMQSIQLPPDVMSNVVTAEQAGIAAPPGTTFLRDPLGNLHPLSQPATGQMVTSKTGQPYAEHYIPGSVNDPTRPQAPPAGYRYAGDPGRGRQEVIPGSGQDPTAPMNVAQGAQTIQGKIQPLLDLAVVAKQSHGAVQEGFKQQNGTGDIAMVNGLQHLIDKGVVRGEDVNMQMKSNGIAGGLGSITQYLNSNGLLTPEVRAKVLRASDALFTNIDQQYKAQVLAHRPTFDALYGPGGFDKYVMPLDYQHTLGWADAKGGAMPPPAPTPMHQPQLTPGSREAAIAEARRRGLVH